MFNCNITMFPSKHDETGKKLALTNNIKVEGRDIAIAKAVYVPELKPET